MSSIRLHGLALLLGGAGLLGCSSTLDVFRCESSAQCENQNRAGTCEPTGLCSFADSDCDDGSRYGDLAGELSNTCVGEGVLDAGPRPDGDPSIPDAARVPCMDAEIVDVATFNLYQDCTELLNISLIDTSLPNLELPNLAQVHGNITVRDNSDLINIFFSDLSTLEGNFTIRDNEDLQGVHPQALQEVGGNFIVRYNDSLAVIDAPLLSRVTGYVRISNNGVMGGVNFPSLLTISNYFELNSNSSLTALVIDTLSSVGSSVTITNNTMFCVDAVPNWNDIAVGLVTIENNKLDCVP